MKKRFSKAMVLLLSVIMMATQFIAPIHAEDKKVEYTGKPCTCEKPVWGDAIEGTKVDPTCEGVGYEFYMCKTCGGRLVKYTDALGHDKKVTKPAVEPTCTEKGSTAEFECNRCGKTFEATERAALGHNPEKRYKQNECGKDIISYDYCTRCKQQVGENVNEGVKEHAYKATLLDELTIKEGCKVTVTYEYSCENCDLEPFRETVVLNDHVLDEGKEVEGSRVNATCEKAGGYKKVHTCTVCGEKVEKPYEIPALGHIENVIPGKAATCTEKGLTEGKYCTRKDCDCNTKFAIGDKEIEHVYVVPKDIDAKGHVEVFHDAKEPTCTENGYEVKITCATCNAVLRQSGTVEAKGHTWDEGKVVQAHSCSADGITKYTCTVCKAEKTEVEPAHNYNYAGTVAPTCTEQGYDFDRCKDCGVVFKKNFTPALGHDLEHHNGETPSCEKEWQHPYDTCKRCDYSTKTDPEKHNFVTVPAKAATYNEAGYKEYRECTICGEKEGFVELPALSEQISFTYTASGAKDSKFAVNSGLLYVNVKMNVTTEQARIWGVNVTLQFDPAHLEFVSAGELNKDFDIQDCTPANIVNKDPEKNSETQVTVARYMGTNEEVTFEKGAYDFVTLIFKVKEDKTTGADFTIVTANCGATRDASGKVSIAADFMNHVVTGKDDKGNDIIEERDTIAFDVKSLGDYNSDGVINVFDSMALYRWFVDHNENDYDARLDMNKDGKVNMADYAYMSQAVVGDDSYLAIEPAFAF